MKKIYKIVIVTLSAGLISLASLAVLYNSYKNQWKTIWTKEEIESIANSIESSVPVSVNFYEVYDSLYPKQRTTNMYTMIIERYKSATMRQLKISRNFSRNVCSCAEIYSLMKFSMISNGGGVLGFGLCEYTTPSKCFDYLVNNLEVYIGNDRIIGLSAVANHVYGKQIAELNREQLIELIRIFRGEP